MDKIVSFGLTDIQNAGFPCVVCLTNEALPLVEDSLGVQLQLDRKMVTIDIAASLIFAYLTY